MVKIACQTPADACRPPSQNEPPILPQPAGL